MQVTLHIWKAVLWAMALIGLVLTALTGCSDDNSVDPSGPMLTVSATRLDFFAYAGLAASPAQQKVIVSNSGTGSLNYTATADAGWIQLGQTGTDTVYITVRAETLPTGSYHDTVVVTSTEAYNSPRLIEVNLTVSERVVALPNLITFSALRGEDTPEAAQLIISAPGGTATAFNVAAHASWLHLSATSGNTPDTLTLTADTTGLIAGTYYDSVVVTSPTIAGYRSLVQVTLTINAWQVSWALGDSASSQSFSLRDLQMDDLNHGWAAGFLPSATHPTGILFWTSDGGLNWSTNFHGPDGRYEGLAFLSPTLGWIVGDTGRIHVTTDNGDTWRSVDNLPFGDDIFYIDIVFVGDDSGWVAGSSGGVMFTSNGGGLWTQQTTPTTRDLREICFVDDTHGWICGNRGTILATSNAGITWTVQTSGTSFDLQGISFVDELHGWSAGTNGTIVSTSDGGATWTPQVSGTSVLLLDVNFANATSGWAVGFDGTILGTIDGGATWTAQASGTQANLFAVQFVDENHGMVVGEGGVFVRTLTGGR